MRSDCTALGCTVYQCRLYGDDLGRLAPPVYCVDLQHTWSRTGCAEMLRLKIFKRFERNRIVAVD